MAFFVVGCTRPLPPELKDLTPVAITVVDADVPLEGVFVTLSSKNSQGLRACVGTTDEQGVADMQTTIGAHVGRGAKPGDYRVVLQKNPPTPEELRPPEQPGLIPESEERALSRKRADFLEKNRIIPRALEQSSTSKVELTVVAGQPKTLMIDLAEYKKLEP